MNGWIRRGRCHKFGDDVPLDDGFIPFSLAIGRVMDPDKLIPRLFEDIRPGFAERAAPGDIVVGGRMFASGKPHVQGFIALRAMGIAMVCESMPYNSFRGAVSQGLTFMADCEGIGASVEDGDDIEIDFATGHFTNHTRGTERVFGPLPENLRQIIAVGGARGMLMEWWAKQRASAPAAMPRAR